MVEKTRSLEEDHKGPDACGSTGRPVDYKRHIIAGLQALGRSVGTAAVEPLIKQAQAETDSYRLFIMFQYLREVLLEGQASFKFRNRDGSIIEASSMADAEQKIRSSQAMPHVRRPV